MEKVVEADTCQAQGKQEKVMKYVSTNEKERFLIVLEFRTNIKAKQLE